MKKLAITIACLTLSLYTYGQGTIQFDTSVSGNMVLSQNGNPATTAYTGQLWGSTTGVTDSFAPIGQPATFFGDTVDSGAGFIISDIVTVGSGSGPWKGDTYYVQLKAWKTADPPGEFGVSPVLTLTLGGKPSDGGLAGFPATLEGLKGFQMVPEPSTIALGLLGAAALLLRRRN